MGTTEHSRLREMASSKHLTLKNQAFLLDGVDEGGEGSQRGLGDENLHIKHIAQG